MPTTATESDKLLEITMRRLTPDQALEYARDLWNELGATTDNESLRVTLEMAMQRAERLAAPPPIPMFGLCVWV